MPRKQKVVIVDPAQIGGGVKLRKVYISWVADDLKRAYEWVGQLREALQAVTQDDTSTPVKTVCPGWRDASASEESMAGNISEVELRDARTGVTDLLVVATSAYLNQQMKQAGNKSDLGQPASELLWFLSLGPQQVPRLPVCWLAPLEQLKLKRYRVGDVNLGDLPDWHHLKSDEARFISLEEGKSKFVDEIQEAMDQLLGHGLNPCQKCRN